MSIGAAELLVGALLSASAFLYTMGGFAGGSMFTAILLLSGVPAGQAASYGLVFNIFSSTSSIVRWRTHVSRELLWFISGSVPAAFIGGLVHVPDWALKVLIGFIITVGGVAVITSTFPLWRVRMRKFLSPIIKDGLFDGKIVVGSPDPHGPFKARARDGHYASYLSLFLGQLVELPEDFAVKLDVDVKAEKEEGNNLILIGGPGTNLLTQEINDFLPIKFNMMPSKHGFLLGGLVSEKTGIVHASDSIGLIAKIVNPWSKEKRIIVLAGNKAVGTKACVMALAKFWKKALKNYNGKEDFATIIQGFDLDGDGKVDSIEVLE